MPYEGETGDSKEVPAPRELTTLEEAKREVAEALKGLATSRIGKIERYETFDSQMASRQKQAS